MADKENQFQGVVESLLKGMDTVLSTKTVVGEATKVGDTIILPLVDDYLWCWCRSRKTRRIPLRQEPADWAEK